MKITLKAFVILSLFLLFLILTPKVKSSSVSGIFINEFLPDAVGSDSGKEWVELYNNSDNAIDITNWSITTKTTSTPRKTIITQYNFPSKTFLIVAEDGSLFSGNNKIVVGAGKLNMYNGNANISLLDAAGNVVDTLNYGDTTEGSSFERKGPLCTDLIKVSTPTIGGQNNSYDNACWQSVPVSSPISFPPPQPQPIPTPNPVLNPLPNPAPTPQPQPQPVSFPSSYPIEPPIRKSIDYSLQISEAYPSPNTSLGEKEWLELYNYGSESINLKGVYLREKGTSTQYSSTIDNLPEIIIDSGNYYVYYGPKISLNNSGDEITLFSPDNLIIDVFKYASISDETSASRVFNNGKYETAYENSLVPLSSILTPGMLNQFPNEAETIPVETKTAVKTPSSSTKSIIGESVVNNFNNIARDSLPKVYVFDNSTPVLPVREFIGLDKLMYLISLFFILIILFIQGDFRKLVNYLKDKLAVLGIKSLNATS